jgi:bifunctional non-homologous end joining protein LigD
MSAQPDWIVPMAAMLTQERFISPEWIFERKYDGIRLLAFKKGSEVRLFSRNHLPQQLPAVSSAIANLPLHDAILDGELLWGAESGFHVFDVPWLEGRDLSPLPLEARRAALNALPFAAPLYHVAEVKCDEPWTRACREGWEGVIAKRRDAPYEQKRSKHWLKMKCEISQDFIVGGFTDPLGARMGLGALLVGYMEGDDFIFAGKVGTGFDTNLLLALRERLERLRVETTPFTKATGLPRVRMHWVRPVIVVHVAFIEWTVHRKLRHSRLLGVRAGVS